MRKVRAKHVSCEDDLSEHLLDIANFEQAHFILRRAPSRAGAEPMCAMEISIPNCPIDAAWWEEVSHLHVRFECLADSKELEILV